jgi:hypothetical protein
MYFYNEAGPGLRMLHSATGIRTAIDFRHSQTRAM